VLVAATIKHASAFMLLDSSQIEFNIVLLFRYRLAHALE
jgi:hypothetical protein